MKSESHKTGSTTLSKAELICDNCINKHMIDEKVNQRKDLQLKDRDIHSKQIERDRAQKQREEEEDAIKKERFRQEASAHWEESKRIKENLKEGNINSDGRGKEK